MLINPHDDELLPLSVLEMHNFENMEQDDYQKSLKYLLRSKIYATEDLLSETSEEIKQRERNQ